jgi:hypothetical protein
MQAMQSQMPDHPSPETEQALFDAVKINAQRAAPARSTPATRTPSLRRR